jgi:hypothetical protein
MRDPLRGSGRAPRPAKESHALPTLAQALGTVALGASALTVAGCERNPFCTPELERAARAVAAAPDAPAARAPLDPRALVASTQSTTKTGSVTSPSWSTHAVGRMPVARWHPPPAPPAAPHGHGATASAHPAPTLGDIEAY